MSLRTADPLTYRALCYLPAERRRLARAGSGRHRYAARRVPLRRRQFAGFTRAFVIETVLLTVPGMSAERVLIFDGEPLGPGTADVQLLGVQPREVEAVQRALDPYLPLHVQVTVRGVARGNEPVILPNGNAIGGMAGATIEA